jgi:hypothetical protein
VVPDRHHNVPPTGIPPKWTIGCRVWDADFHVIGHKAMLPIDLEVEPVLVISLRIALLDPQIGDH